MRGSARRRIIPCLAADCERGRTTTIPAMPNPDYGPNFESIRKNFFIAAASFLAFDSAMSVGKPTATDGAQWYVQADHVRRFGHGLHATHAGLDDKRANSLALIITTSLLFVLLASAVLVGGRAVISPLMHPSAVTGNTTNNRGDIVYTMPDGMFCQHMTFDNTTGRITTGGMDRCDPSTEGDGGRLSTGFKWGSH
jgi:hypothetical protein